ncbi:MAG: arginine--tRNA ligase [Oscillospiraceae bacterium]
MNEIKYLNPKANAMNEAKALLCNAAAKAFPDKEMPSFVIEIPADNKNGDIATNFALAAAKLFGAPPRNIATALCEELGDLSGTSFSRAEIAGPGFINFFLADKWFCDVVSGVLDAGENYGRTQYGEHKKINVEFVSANPTGPMHLGNARGGALGDCLAAAMDWAGYDVTREFLINDAGNQIIKFGKSLAVRYLQIFKGEDAVALAEDGYQGEDIKTLAKEFADIHGDAYTEKPMDELCRDIVAYALPKNVQGLKDDLAKYRINYDVWFSETTLHESGAIDKVLKTLKDNGATYESEGAVWYKASEYGAEKDEVLVRANGIPTYFAADIAYHYNKFAQRGFDTAIDVWGADHHGHVARMKGAMDAIGLDGSKLDVVLMQLVRLVRDGEPVRMSKRTGKAITLTDLLDEVPIDSARFFFNLREPGSQMEFDLGLAVSQDSDNPVYYVQYAHARICSILKNLAAEGIVLGDADTCNFSLLQEPSERELIRFIAGLPDEIIAAAKNYDPARITRYAVDLATLYHKFYNACRVKDAEPSLCQARLALCTATKTVIANVLGMLKITIPESM